MKISIQSMGTLGDVVPYLGLAQGLIAAGHDVSFLSTEEFTDFIASHGIATPPPIPLRITDWMAEAEERGTLSNPITFLRDWNLMVKPTIEAAFHAAVQASAGADVVVSNLAVTARAAAEIHKIPLIFAAQQPVLADTGELPCALVTGRNFGRIGNRATYLARTLLETVGSVSLRHHRQTADLPRVIFPSMRQHLGRPLPLITTVANPLLDKRPDDWRPHQHLTNYWRPTLQSDWNCPTELANFLDIGPPPIYVGLGSMNLKKPDFFANVILDALANTGTRGLLWAKDFKDFLPADSPHMLLDFAPHAQIFPRCAGIIHHGGAGTVTAALASGKPQALVPHFLDQFWHARRMKSLGLIPDFASTVKITPKIVQDMIAHFQSPAAQQVAKNAQTKILAQDGVADATKIIETHVKEFNAD